MLFKKYGVSVRGHIQQGILLPLDARNDLVKNVTTRVHGVCMSLSHAQ